MLGGVYGISGAGDAGLEYAYNKFLSGTAGERRIVNDAIHQPISIDEVRPMHSGKTVQLTLDAALQNEVEQVLAGVGEQYQPRAATAIAMNPNTRRDPGAGQLAARQRQRSQRRAQRRRS